MSLFDSKKTLGEKLKRFPAERREKIVQRASQLAAEEMDRRVAFLVGKIKSFGPLGPKYEIGQPLRELPNGDWMIAIVLVETGEKTEYRLSHLMSDSDAL